MKPNTEHLSMLENDMYVAPKDWMKRIRAEIQHIRQAHAKAMKKNKRISGGLLDLTPAMEKHRTSALMSSLENLSEERQKYADDWITLNIFSESYAPVQYDGHILTAAAIWILDRLTEQNIPLDKIYQLLPRDDELLDDLFEVDVWDSQYDENFVASVEYVLFYRNQDIAPLESNGGEGYRVITSDLAADGKDHADVPSRQNFEALLSLLPQQVKDEAVKHFETCYQIWTDRFFAGIAYWQEQYIEKRDALNAIRKEINEVQDKLDKKAKQYIAERKQAKKAKKEAIKPANVLLRNPQQPNLPTLSTPGYATSPITALLNGGFDNGLDPEIGVLLSRLKSLDDRHHQAADELDAVVSKRGKFLYMIVHRGYFTRDFVEEYFPEALHEKLLTPLPITDPFELCFALLYLVETGSDIPWLYGSCIGMMSEVIDCLPWGLSDYSEMEDPYWEEVSPIVSKTPDFPDWYQRDYSWKGDDEYDARSLAQIVYEATGCLMPRDIHRYDAMLKDLGKYGIKQNKAIAMLYCMLALSNARRRVNPNNLEADYMRVISHEEPVAETTPADWAEQKAALEKQIQQLRSALHTAEKSAEESKRKLEQQQKQAEAEHRELADLREIVFNRDIVDESEDVAVDNAVYPYTVQKSTVVFGGHETWVKALKPLLKGDIKFIAREMKIDVSLVRYADAIWIQSNAIPHRSYYSIVNTARKLGKPIRYFTNASAAKCAEQIVENDKRGA